MQLSREQIERWAKSVGGNVFGGNAGGGGGGADVDLGSYATKAWVENDYVSKAFFNELFTVHGTKTTTVGSGTPTVEPYTFEPNEVPSTTTTTEDNVTTTVVTAITDIEVGNTSLQKYIGLWTSSFLSALGQGSGGGGGGASALDDLTDVSLSSPTNGQALVYNATSRKWENQTIGGGGGGTLTSIGLVMPTGFAVNPATLTADGSFTVSFATGYGLPLTADVQKGVTAYNNLSNYLPTSTSFWGCTVANGEVKGNIQMENNTSIRMKPNGGDGQYWNVLTMNTGNTLALGYYTRTHGQDTDIQGSTITFAVNGGSGTASSAVDNRVDAMTIDENGRVWIKIAAQGLRIGDGLITWDSQNNALKIQRISGSSVVEGGLYATSFLSALGANSGGGGSGVGDVTWAALADSNDTRAIAFSHFSNTLANAHVGVASLSISGECSIYDEGGDLVLTATNGDVYIEDDCTINGTTWISSTLGVNSLATFNGSIVVKYDGATRFSFSTPYTNVHLLTIDAGGIFTDSVSAPSFINTSDERKKNVVDYNAALTVDQVANAPAVHFTWKDSADNSTHVGTLAQYWRDICPEAVPENYDGFYGVDYAVLAMLSSISIARRIQELEQEIEQLKKAL